MDKNITLFGGKNITVNFEAAPDAPRPEPAQVKVRQIPVREYETGFPLADDEPALVGFLCARNKPWALTLTPESYEEALAAGREVNRKGFFTYCQRRTERDSKAQADMIGLMATLPAETVKLAMERGLAMQAKSHSPTLSPGFAQAPVR